MKHLITTALIVLSITVLATTVVQATCTPAPTSGNDTIICTGTTTGDVNTGDGNDTLTNNGTSDGQFLGGDGNDTLINNGFVDDDLEGDDGNDILINNNIVDDDLRGDDGDDLIINNGFVGDEAFGGSGNDIIINNGVVVDDLSGESGDDIIINNNIVIDDLRGDSGDDVIINNGIVGDGGSTSTSDGIFGGSGDDIIINNGVVDDNIFAGSGDDIVIINRYGTVGQIISGGSGFDTLLFNARACLDTDGEFIRSFLTIEGLNPNSDNITLDGHTYTWVEFEELVATLLVQFCDGRHEVFDTATPLVSYCNIFNGLDIYDVNEIGVDGRFTEGLLTIRTTQLATREIVQLSVSTGQNLLIASDNYGNQLWALSSNELQIMGPEVDDPTKIYTFILPAGVCGIN